MYNGEPKYTLFCLPLVVAVTVPMLVDTYEPSWVLATERMSDENFATMRFAVSHPEEILFPFCVSLGPLNDVRTGNQVLFRHHRMAL